MHFLLYSTFLVFLWGAMARFPTEVFVLSENEHVVTAEQRTRENKRSEDAANVPFPQKVNGYLDRFKDRVYTNQIRAIGSILSISRRLPWLREENFEYSPENIKGQLKKTKKHGKHHRKTAARNTMVDFKKRGVYALAKNKDFPKKNNERNMKNVTTIYYQPSRVFGTIWN